MKKTLLTILIALCATFAWGQNAETLAHQADELYRHGDHQAAAESYEAALAQGLTSADLHYNLGNAYYRLEQLGPAILHYERALRLKPSMRDAKENLALANSKTQDRITELPRLFLVNWYNALCSHITPRAWRIVWLLLLALLSASMAAFILARSIPLRKATFTAAIVSAVLLLLASLLLLSSTNRFNSHHQAIVIQQAISVRNSPEQQSPEKFILHEGTKVTITESLAGWDKITLADGTIGWCEANTIERI